jgi:alkylation response protein AidB-like acyl-CoA dehydrogenase
MQHFELNDEQSQILDTTRKFVADVVEPAALEHDEHRTFVQGSIDGLAELGLFGLPIAEEAGGFGLGTLSLVVAIEELAKGCGSTARLLTGQCVCGKVLEGLEAGTDALEKLVGGEALGAFVGLEHGITATADGDGLRLDGTAELVTGAGKAGMLVVAARTADGEAVVAVVDAANATVEDVPAVGFHAAAPAKVSFAGTSAPAVARGADAEAAIARGETTAWIAGAATAVGTGFASIEAARRHTAERIAFGKPLAKQQAVAHKLVESRRAVDAARHQTWHAARLADLGDAGVRDAALHARLSAVDAALRAADEAIQSHGGYGYTVEYHVERHYRDMQMLETLEHGAEWMRDALVASVLA